MTHASLRMGTVVIAIFCLVPGRPPIAAGPADTLWQAAGCGPSMQNTDRLRSDLGLDNALANRANALADSSLASGQPPSPTELDSLAQEGFDGLNDAADQLDQAASEIGTHLESMNMRPQQAAWTRGVQQLRTARTNLRSVQRTGAGRSIGSSGAAIGSSGTGHRWIAEAAGVASDYGSAAANLNRIALDGNFINLSTSPGVHQGASTLPPPPNPQPNTWQDALRRMQAQQARVNTNLNGVNAAQAMQARQFPQARQNVAEMRRALDQAQSWLNVLNQAVALCQQAQQQQQQRPAQQTQPANTQPSAGSAGGAASGGGGGGAGAVLGGLGAAAAVVGGIALYQAATVCTEPDQQFLQSATNSCGSGNCSSCLSLAEEIARYCDCAEAKGDVPSGTCGTFRADIEDWRRMYCEAPMSYTPVPKRRGTR